VTPGLPAKLFIPLQPNSSDHRTVIIKAPAVATKLLDEGIGIPLVSIHSRAGFARASKRAKLRSTRVASGMALVGNPGEEPTPKDDGHWRAT